ncbi:hypothetical protein CBR_g28487 [Chara braunii]|uniref:Peptidase A2 domain-containing protein n=1 Tax=Chara braunii TaxID=69332 RepID=A0A388JW28_CHABU|nr:hypothetical protein CBR_g28487 [Chara braunii]|eukprot:GBG62011.1 hypothetical protein CBR_g28487 [Chara braunii]
MPEGMADGGKRLVTLDDLIDALDKRERAPSYVPKVDTFHFKGERVSDWLDLTEQALPVVRLSDEIKLQRILRYVLYSHHKEVGKVVDAANGSWARFRDMMQRKYRLGDGLLTAADLEAMNKDEFSTIGAFVHEFKRKARKVHEISEETQCAIFLGLLTGAEAAELIGHGGGNDKLTWATIDKGVEEGSLDQVEQHQVQLQRRKRKERDATASGTPGVKRIVTDVLAALGYDNEAEVQKRGVTVAQGRTSGAVEEEAGCEDYGGEETGSQILTNAQRKQQNLLMGGLISSCMDGDIYDKWGEHIDPRTPGGIRQEALRRAAAGPSVPPAMFRMWQEREESAIRVEEIVGDSEEVTQRLKAKTIREEPIVVESDDEGQGDERELAILILEKMEDLLEKVGRYQQKLQTLCEEALRWEANLPEVFLYDSGPEPSSGQQGYPRVATVGTGPRSGMTYKPPMSHGRAPQAARTRSQNKARPSQESSQAPCQAPPRKEPEPGCRREVAEVPEEEEEDDDEEDERLRQEEDQRAELRAKKRGAREEAEPSLPDSVPKRKKYAVRMKEGFDMERMVDKLLEGHNDLMNLKDILASAPRLRGELKDRLSRRLVPNVHLSTVLPREVEWTEAGTRMGWKCVACGQVDLVIKNQKCTGMVDTGAEMNIIREKEAVMMGMEIDRSDHACGNYEVITCRNTGPGSGRNRPSLGSFTFEESENERRRLWEVPEEEDRAEVLTLSLTDVNKAMEVVSAHDMADPETIKALREQVLENPQVGEVREGRPLRLDTPARDPWKEEAMAQRGAVAGPSGPALRKGGQRREQRISRNLEELPIYRAGDSLRVFLRDLEEYALRKEWGDREKIANLAAERGEWSEEEKRKQLIARSDKGEKEEVRGIVEGSRTWKRITAELWMAYTQARQDRTRKERLQNKGLWIGREVTEPQGKEEENEEEDNVPLKKLKNKARVPPKSSSKESEQAEGDEQEEEEAVEERKRSMGASMVPRKKKLGKKRAIESERKEVQERVSEKGEGVEEDEEGKEI